MAARRLFRSIVPLVCLALLAQVSVALGGDKCIFAVTADSVPPNIIILLDNGAEMEQIAWHKDYNPNVDYTPPESIFVNPYGYAPNNKNQNELLPIGENLKVGESPFPKISAVAGPDGTITITLGEKSVNLPKVPSSSPDSDNVKDNSTYFRYSTNYLNWLVYSRIWDGSPLPKYDGTNLPNKSRFYWAKKAIRDAARQTNNQARFGIMNFSNTEGASSVQPVAMVMASGSLTSSFINNINNMGTVDYSPLAEGLASVGGQYAGKNLSQEISEFYCQRNFALIVSAGMSSMDQTGASQSSPSTLGDFDGDGATGGLGEGKLRVIRLDGTSEIIDIPVNLANATTASHRGSTYLDDVAHWLYTNDVVGYRAGFQNISTFTVGAMPTFKANAFLANTSNKGNGYEGIYDQRDRDTFKYHFEAEEPEGISDAIIAALKNILERTATFTAPVVPVTRTTSGDLIYLAFFKPLQGSNLWEGNITKFGLSSNNDIVSVNGAAATWPNGAMRDDASPHWATIKWAKSGESNYVHHPDRQIFTYLSNSQIISSSNAFTAANSSITSAMLGVENATDRQKIIDYVRGKSPLTNDNRRIIHGDSLHSEPFVLSWANGGRYIFFGANDGMLHAVNDVAGTEAWSFIPPDQLPRLKDMVSGTSHQYYIDSSPKVVVIGGNRDHVVDSGETAILICGERKGGNSYFALDVTSPTAPRFLWRLSGSEAARTGIPAPSVNANIAQSWSEPVFGKVKTSANDTTGTQVMFIGGGYDPGNLAGKVVLVVNVENGNVIKSIPLGNFSAPANVTVVDANNNGFIDKAYIGDMGGQLWRIGKFDFDDHGEALQFPKTNENVNTWGAQLLFSAGGSRKIFYSVDIALEYGYDLLLFGTGNRENPCAGSDGDRIYAIKDNHVTGNLTETGLTNISNATANLDGTSTSMGWYYPLQAGEKILSEGTLFYGVFYVTSFLPRSDDPCKPGGDAILYGLKYKTGGAGLKIDGTTVQQSTIGGGIGSKPIIVIREDSQSLLVSVGSTNATDGSESTGAGVRDLDPAAPTQNLFLMWWQEIFN
ncbi:MAG: hypothetical protein IH614_00765 [Desulfuromonadales bacterium]|nr:hypothetical protein [Desulfuromonadales bacterium]